MHISHQALGLHIHGLARSGTFLDVTLHYCFIGVWLWHSALHFFICHIRVWASFSSCFASLSMTMMNAPVSVNKSENVRFVQITVTSACISLPHSWPSSHGSSVFRDRVQWSQTSDSRRRKLTGNTLHIGKYLMYDVANIHNIRLIIGSDLARVLSRDASCLII